MNAPLRSLGEDRHGFEWQLVVMFGLSFGMAGLMIIGAITSYQWLAEKFQ